MDIRKAFAGATSAVVAFSQIATGVATAATFSDVSSDHWSYEYVEQLVEDGVIDAADNYRPDDSLNRAELVKIALLAANIDLDTDGAPSFTDVSEDAWYYDYVATAAKLGIVGGYTNADGNATGEFGPSDVVNRAAATKILVNAFGISFDLTPASTFSDVTDTTAWYYPYVVTAYNQSILDGYSNGTFGPNDPVTRAQIAKLAVNSANPVERSTDSDDDDDEPASVAMGDGELLVELSDDTPSSATLPQSTEGATVAAFDFTASDEDDVTVTQLSILRSGLGADATLSAVALFDEDGNRISKAKSFTSADDMANINILDGGLEIQAGKTVTVYARVNVGAAASNNQFALALNSATAITSNAQAVDGDFPVVANTFDVGSVTASELIVESDGMPSNVKLGQTGVEISKFKLRNNSSNNSTITVHSVTLKEEGTVDEEQDLENFELYIDDELVASAETASGKYVNFVFDEPIVIDESKTVKGRIKADIVGGASTYINFQVDNDLDIQAVDDAYGYGANITATSFNTANDGSASSKYVAIEAGELSLVAIDAPKDKTREDKNDVVLGSIEVSVNAGQDLELQKVAVQIKNTNTAGNNIDDIFESGSIEIAVDGSVYDLNTASTTASTTITYSDDDLSVRLADGETVNIEIRGDVKSGIGASFASDVLEVSLSSIGGSTKSASSFYVEETQDDKPVTDVTPSSITFKTVKGASSTVTVNTVVQSSSKSAVIGSTEVPAMIFEVEAGEISALTLDEVKVKAIVTDSATGGTITMDGQDTAGGADPANDADALVVTYYDASTANIAVDLGADKTDAQVATAVAAAIDATSGFSASASGAVVTFTTTLAVESINTASLVGSMNTSDGGAADASATVALSNNGSDTTGSNTRINKMSLYEGTYSAGATPLDTTSGSQLSSGVATFDSFKSEIAQNGTQRYTVTMDIINDANQANDTIQAQLTSVSVEDDDSDDVTTGTVNSASKTLTSLTENSSRTITIKGTGTLTATVDTTDEAVDHDVWVLGGTTYEYVASYELVATNENIKINDLTINEKGSAATLKNAVSEVIIHDASGAEIGRKSVTSDTVSFTDINYTVEEGSENIYIAVETWEMGKDEAGSVEGSDDTTTNDNLSFTLSVTDAEGVDSGKTVTNPAETGASKAFGVIPTKITSVEFVSSYGGTSVISELTGGTSDTIAVVKITTEGSNPNTDLTDDSTLKTQLATFKFDVSTNTAPSSVIVERISGSGDYSFTAALDATGTGNGAWALAGTLDRETLAVTLGSADTVNYQIDNGSSAYYAIKLSGADIAAARSAQVLLDLNSQITYSSDDADGLEVAATTDARDSLRLDDSTIEATQITYKP